MKSNYSISILVYSFLTFFSLVIFNESQRNGLSMINIDERLYNKTISKKKNLSAEIENME